MLAILFKAFAEQNTQYYLKIILCQMKISCFSYRKPKALEHENDTSGLEKVYCLTSYKYFLTMLYQIIFGLHELWYIYSMDRD